MKCAPLPFGLQSSLLENTYNSYSEKHFYNLQLVACKYLSTLISFETPFGYSFLKQTQACKDSYDAFTSKKSTLNFANTEPAYCISQVES